MVVSDQTRHRVSDKIKVYKRGQSVNGRPAYSGLLLFKMLLTGIWYGLSDGKAEESVNENLLMMCFCAPEIEDILPDHSVLSHFLSELTEKKVFDQNSGYEDIIIA